MQLERENKINNLTVYGGVIRIRYISKIVPEIYSTLLKINEYLDFKK
jgi:hypothetical protein